MILMRLVVILTKLAILAIMGKINIVRKPNEDASYYIYRSAKPIWQAD